MVPKHARICNDDGYPTRDRAEPPTYRPELERGLEPFDPDPTTTAIGAGAEQRAAAFLEARGYRVVERNFRSKLGELDLVACDDGVLCFVEVRSRADGDHGHAAETVTWAKRRKVVRAAYAYLAERRPRFETARFDVVAITGETIDLIRDAWRL